MKYLKLIKYQNLLLLATMLLVFRYLFLTQSYIDLALTDFNYLLLVLSTVCIAAGGAVMQHIVNQEEDEIIHPQSRLVGNAITETSAYNWYIGLTIVGVGIGFYLSNVIYKPTFASLFVLVATLLYVQATNLKQIPFINNCITALLVAIPIITIALFDVFPATDATNKVRMGEVFGILIDYAIFSFFLVLLKELVNDLKNKHNDEMVGNTTLATRLGLLKTKIIVGVFVILILAMILYYCKNYLFELNLALYYILITMVGPLLLVGLKLINSTNAKEFIVLNRVLQFVLITSLFSIAVIIYSIQHA
jgi:4-hydroxybenzoate polyprenyltransferase